MNILGRRAPSLILVRINEIITWQSRDQGIGVIINTKGPGKHKVEETGAERV